MMNDIESYKPELINPDSDDRFYGLVLVELYKCPKCEKFMFRGPESRLYPRAFRLEMEAQLSRAGWVPQSKTIVDDKYICMECEKTGKADFLCALCEERKPTSKIKESVGDPAEFLCTDCFETVPAKIWHEKEKLLRDDHRYDYE